ncbi:MAG: cobalamin biosynthesis protein [Lachnospiraceae bacterium]|nr:cobalamin biosynthesis protein [Lachnospiraceae bacterium]
MRITGICFTRSGMELAQRIHRWFSEENATLAQDYSVKNENAALAQNYSAEQDSPDSREKCRDFYQDSWFCKGKLFRDAVPEGFSYVEEGMQQWAGEHFPQSDAMIFIGATGICVRAIAPWVKDKKTDPAVLCFDEKGTFGISLLSGHIGGANALTEKLCQVLGSTPVVTTATDVNRKFAVDVYATEQNLAIGSMELAKDVAAALVEGKEIPFSADTELIHSGKLPGGLKLYKVQKDALSGGLKLVKAEKDASEENKSGSGNGLESTPLSAGEMFPLGIHVSPFKDRHPYAHTLQLIPRCIVLGIGCRRDTPVDFIEELADQVLQQHQIHPQAVKAVATIDLKKDEKGLLEFCRRRNLPLTVYSAEELRQVEGDFSASGFVSGITGVDNVCERSAVKNSQGTLIVKKTKGKSSTCAAALEDWRIKI